MQSESLAELLGRYRLTDANIVPLEQNDDLLYRVVADEGAFVLRVRAPAVTAARVALELAWLAALARDTTLRVPEPIADAAGEQVVWWSFADERQPRACVLYRWLDGEPLSRQFDDRAPRLMAQLAAQLHRHARIFVPPAAAAGAPCYHEEALFGPTSWWGSGRARFDLGEESYAALEPAVRMAVAGMRAVGRAPEQFGVIHSDLHFRNVLLDSAPFDSALLDSAPLDDRRRGEQGRLAVLDFGDCGYGHYLFDLAVTELEFGDYPHAEALIADYRAAYLHAMGLPAVALAPLRAFEVAAGMTFLAWVFTSESPSVRAQKLPYVAGLVAEMAIAVG